MNSNPLEAFKGAILSKKELKAIVYLAYIELRGEHLEKVTKEKIEELLEIKGTQEGFLVVKAKTLPLELREKPEASRITKPS